MKYLEARHLRLSQVKAVDIPALFNQNNIPYNSIDVINWHVFPYCPKVEFAIAHTGDTILLHYRVEEGGVRAVAGEDLGNVWEDSCCEFFASPDADGSYYNLESNCIGTILLCNGKGREERMQAPLSALKKIDRWASLGRKVIGLDEKAHQWELSLVIPVSAFFRHEIDNLSGLIIHGNFYKCGDKTAHPHFLSWNPIDIPSPDFHRPDFFGEIKFL